MPVGRVRASGAMAKINYRIVTLVAALGSAVLTAISLAFLVTAVVKFRAEDFFTATTTKDFTALGTCVESITHDQLKELDYNNADLKCKDNNEQGNKRKLINTLRSTVHSVYWTYHNGKVDDGTNSNPPVLVDAKDVHIPGHYLRTVMAAQIGHVLGRTAPMFTAGVGGTQESFSNVGLNYSMVYEALSLVSEVDIPASCDDIYGLTFQDISNDHQMFDQSVATQALPGMAGVQIGGHYVDTEWETYIKNIRKGRLDDNDDTKTTWPLQEFVIDCPGEAQTLGQDYIPDGGTEEDQALSADAKKYMYAHCTAQFQFASVGSHAWDGTYGIPLPGIEPGPFARWYPHPDGFNSTSSYNMRARMYLGQRFGLAVWAYVPMFLATVFLLGDCIVFFFTEALMPVTLADQYAFASNTLNNVRDSLVIMATTRASRRKRLALGFAAVFVAWQNLDGDGEFWLLPYLELLPFVGADLQARGLDRLQARALLLEGWARDFMSHVPSKNAKDRAADKAAFESEFAL